MSKQSQSKKNKVEEAVIYVDLSLTKKTVKYWGVLAEIIKS